MAGSYDPWLVVLSVLIAATAGMAALTAAERRAECRDGRRLRSAWLAGGAVAMGLGVWCMHFVGMLAFRLPVPVRYDLGWTLASMIPAVGASAVAIHLAGGARGAARLHLGGLLIGAGIGAMHYLGMAAVILDARMAYDPALFVLSLVVAYALAAGALHIEFRLKSSTLAEETRTLLAGCVLGGAVSGMHYTGMAATRFFGAAPPGAQARAADAALAPLLAMGAGAIAVAFIGIAYFDRRLSATALKVHRLIETAPDCFVVVDPKGRIRLFNAMAEKVFGWRREEVLGNGMEILLPERLRQVHGGHREQYGREPGVRLMGTGRELIARRKDGSEFPVEVSLSPERTPGGLFVTAIIRDVSERAAAHALEALVELEHRVTKILSSGLDPIDAAPDIIGCICERLGVRYGGWWLVKPVERELRWLAAWHADGPGLPEFDQVSRGMIFKEGAGLPGRVLASGSPAWIADVQADRDFPRAPAAAAAGLRAAFAFPLQADGETLGVMDFLSDRTLAPDAKLLSALRSLGNQIALNLKRRRIEQQAVHSQRLEAVGRLAGGIAHDFNNHLTGIIGLAGILARQAPPGSQAAADAEEILAIGERSAHLVKQLLALNRKTPKNSAVYDANELVAQNAGLLARLVGSQISVETRLGDEPLPVRVDRNEFSQVLLNLLVNARDAMPKGGVVTISTKKAGLRAEIAVRDGGTGIPVEIQDHIFEPYYSTKDETRGTGLGLSIVHAILRDCGADIGVESAPGEGATFLIRFPLAEGPITPARPKEAGPAEGTAEGLVLLVEDNPAVARVTARMLERIGYTVLRADGAESAITLFEKRGAEIAVVVTDVNMPGAGGVGLSERLRDLRPRTKVLFISGFGQDALGLAQAADRPDFLAKPFTEGELALKIKELLAGQS